MAASSLSEPSAGFAPKTAPSPVRRRGRELAAGVALVALCLWIYLPGLANEFVWDDEMYISRNPHVLAGLSPQGLHWAFTTFHTGNWHPVTWISHLTDVQLFGLNPIGHHLASLLFHCTNAVLTFFIFRRLTGRLWTSALVAALFAVHPLHVESVAWAAERKDVLSTTLWLLSLLAWRGWLRRQEPVRYLAVGSFFTLALAAKPMPATLPFLLLLLDWWPLGRFIPGRRWALVVEKLPLFVLAAAAGAVSYLAQSRIGAVGNVPFFVRLANSVISYWAYLGKTLWPSRLTLLYPFPMGSPHFPRVVLALAALAVTTALVILIRQRSPALTVGWFWFLGTLAPVIGLVQIGPQAMADRYTYIPLTGLFMMAVWGIGELVGRRRRSVLWPPVAMILVVVLTAAARGQVRTWHDPLTAFRRALAVTKDNRLAHFNLGVYHQERGENRLAEEHFRAAIAIWNGYADAHCNLGLVFESGGRTEEAIREYREAIRANPRLAEAYYNLGTLQVDIGQWFPAEINLKKAMTLRPDDHEAPANLGRLLARQGRILEALPLFREAVRLAPQTALNHQDLGVALLALGRRDEAAAALREALRLDPGLEIARKNLAKTSSGSGERVLSGETRSR